MINPWIRAQWSLNFRFGLFDNKEYELYERENLVGRKIGFKEDELK